MENEIKLVGNEFQLRFIGEGMSPRSIPVHEVCEVLVAFEKAVKAFVESEDETAKNACIYLTSVDDESLGLKFLPNYLALATSAIISIASAINENNFDAIPPQARAQLEPVFKFTRQHNCRGQLNSIGGGKSETLAEITPQTSINKPHEMVIRGTTSVFAFVQKAGGGSPKIHVVFPDETGLICDATRDAVESIRVYDWFTFHGDATWDAETNKLLTLKITRASQNRPMSAVKAFGNMAEKFDYLFIEENPDDFTSRMRSD